MVGQEEGLGAVVEKYLRRFYAAAGENGAETNMYDSVIGEVERRLISVTLEAAAGNRLKASRILGINRNTLLRKMRRLNLDDREQAALSGKTAARPRRRRRSL